MKQRSKLNMKTSCLSAMCVILACVSQLGVSFPLRFSKKTVQIDGPPGVQLLPGPDNRHVVIDNGIFQVTLSVPEGFITGVKYGSMDNLLETGLPEDDRGYWDVTWYKPGEPAATDWLRGEKYTVVMQTREQVELSFTRSWSPAANNYIVPLNVDKRIIVKSGMSGFYMYGILERLSGWPDVDMDEIRIVFKLSDDKFGYMAISDDIQRSMPTYQDRVRGTQLAYKEAVLLSDETTNSQFYAEVDDKYQYAMESQDIKVHGWTTRDQRVGFWMIKPSNEFYAGGPIKQELTLHTGPILLSMFTSLHYAGKDMNTSYRNGEPWKKVFGPIFVYLNSVPQQSPDGNKILWEDAKRQMTTEVTSWPYDFVQSTDFPSSNERGFIGGQFLTEYNVNSHSTQRSSAYVGLANPGAPDSWQYDSKGYQFWTKTDSHGNFIIENVRPGVYMLYAWAPGFIGGFRYDDLITINPGSNIDLGIMTFISPRNGPTIWEIGYPDRSAKEFFVPPPIDGLINTIFINQPYNQYRQYGLWEKYTQLFPTNDLVYEVGVNDYRNDWFFAQVPRNLGNQRYLPTTWQIKFGLNNVNPLENYTLQLSLASATESNLQVRFNDPKVIVPHFSTGYIGKDNAIARHGTHGLYRLYSVNLQGCQLINGTNTIYLTQAKALSPWEGVLYDYIRLEGPRSTSGQSKSGCEVVRSGGLTTYFCLLGYFLGFTGFIYSLLMVMMF